MTGQRERAIGVLRRHAQSLASAIVNGAGAGSVEAIFAGGSLATGEVAWYEGDALEVFSDVDLYVVARAGRCAEVRRAVDAARLIEPEAGVRLMRSMDIGVFTLDQLLAEPARPGTVHLGELHVMLYGDESTVARMSSKIATVIDPGEGLNLIENRVLELPDPQQGASDAGRQRLCRYQLLKTVLDAVTGLLVGLGRYRATVAQRTDELLALDDAGALPVGWDRDLLDEALAARADLQGYLSGAGDDIVLSERVARFTLGTWKSAAQAVYPGVDSAWAPLLLRRCRKDNYGTNLREFVRMSTGLGRSRSRMAWTGLRLSRYSALSALRLSGVLEAVMTQEDGGAGEEAKALREYLECLTAAFGFREGTVFERAHAMQRATQSG